MRLDAATGLLLSALAASACAAQQGKNPTHPAALQSVKIESITLTDEQFAPSVAELLRDGAPTTQRLSQLVAAVRWQLARAGGYFAAGHEEAALDAVLGALLLVRAGELRQEMFEGQQQTLLLAAGALSRRGDEGGAEALYELAEPLLPAGRERRDVSEHLAALRAWQSQTQAPGSMLEAGARRSSLAKRALLNRTPEAVSEAERATAEWVERSFEIGDLESPPTTHDELDEQREARQARILGAPTMAALFLRDGDAAGALQALEDEPMEAVTSSKLLGRLNDAADGEPEAWAEMFGLYQFPKSVSQLGLDPDVAVGAAWGSALELYRTDPSSVPASMGVSTLLAQHNLGDVAPLVLVNALGERPHPRELSWGLGLLIQSLAFAEQRGDLVLARRAFANAERLVALAASPAYADKVKPSAAELEQAIGGLETRAGFPERARPHLEAAARKNPAPQSLRLLAAIARQRGDVAEAERALQAMLQLARATSDLGGEAATWVMVYDLLREQGDVERSQGALSNALNAALGARLSARAGAQLASVERVLADVLERYGDRLGANRAVDRARDAARNDHAQLSATLLDAARRALVLQDVEAGRRALRHALDQDLDDEDLLYAALWVKLLQARAAVPSDGSVEEALIRVDSEAAWIEALRDWARGSVSNAQLLARATSPVQRTEAEFYAALGGALAEPAQLAQLASVAKSPAIELVEVRIAQELVLAQKNLPRPVLPQGIEIP